MVTTKNSKTEKTIRGADRLTSQTTTAVMCLPFAVKVVHLVDINTDTVQGRAEQHPTFLLTFWLF